MGSLAGVVRVAFKRRVATAHSSLDSQRRQLHRNCIPSKRSDRFVKLWLLLLANVKQIDVAWVLNQRPPGWNDYESGRAAVVTETHRSGAVACDYQIRYSALAKVSVGAGCCCTGYDRRA